MRSFKEYKYDYGTPESIKSMKKVTPGQNEAVKNLSAADQVKAAIKIIRDKRFNMKSQIDKKTAIQKISKDLLKDPKVKKEMDKIYEENDMVKELSMKSDKKNPNLKVPVKGKKGTSKFMRMKAVTQTKNEDKDPSEYDEEGLMMKDQLDIVMDAADEIYDIVENNENLPEWCQNKITKAADYIDSVRDYLKSQKTTNEGSGPSMADLQKRANIKKADQNKLLKIRQMLDKERKNRPNPK